MIESRHKSHALFAQQSNSCFILLLLLALLSLASVIFLKIKSIFSFEFVRNSVTVDSPACPYKWCCYTIWLACKVATVVNCRKSPDSMKNASTVGCCTTDVHTVQCHLVCRCALKIFRFCSTFWMPSSGQQSEWQSICQTIRCRKMNGFWSIPFTPAQMRFTLLQMNATLIACGKPKLVHN